MEDQGGDDPFLWKNDRLVQELCTTSRSWPAPAMNKMPSPIILEQKLREHGMDGEDLLTYEDVIGPGSTEALFKDLGITKIPHKASMKKTIKILQAKSQSYRRWRHENLQDGDANTAGPGSQGLIGIHNLKEISGPTPPGAQALYMPNNTQQPSALPAAVDNGVVDKDGAPPDEEPAKKKIKRIVPTLVPRPSLQLGAYLGPQRLERALGTQKTEPGGTEDDSVSLVQLGPKSPGISIIVARQLRRSLRPRNVSLGRGRARGAPSTIEAGTANIDPDVVLPAFGDSDDDYDTETWAEIEAEEADRKKLEAKQLKDGKKRPIEKGKVDLAIKRAIEHLENSWKSDKLPKLRERANRLWHTGRKKAVRQQIILGARKSGRELQVRMNKCCDTIRELDWATEEEVYKVATGSLEQTVHDKMDCSWTISVLNSPSEPKKFRRPNARLISKGKKPSLELGDDEEELYSSDSSSDFIVPDDDGETGWISDTMDVDDGFAQHEHLEVDAADSADSSDENYACFDLTQIPDSSDEERQLPEDLKNDAKYEALFRTPRKTLTISEASPAATSRDEAKIETDFPFSKPQEIAAMGTKYWRRLGDNRRLVITILCGMDDKLLARLFDYLHNMRDPDDLWRKFCRRAIERPSASLEMAPGTPNALLEELAFNFNRLLLAFSDCTSPSSGEWRPVSKYLIGRLQDNRPRIASFRDFIDSIVKYFPKSQPTDFLTPRKSSTKPSGESSCSEDDSALEVDRSSPSKERRRRQVPQDKAAMKLRKDDLLRVKEQEERRNALRERLARSDYTTISRDASRLIINESKLDDQGEIFVNSTIAERIKDHQINGVRFMWNQIIGPDSRQGCLLAHTMGLGKTMQVITLLVAIAEAALSDDPRINSQIHIDLRDSKTLVLCPSGLVNNWHDELLLWTPQDLLGPFHSVDAQVPQGARAGLVADWAVGGSGVLIIGYDLFRNLMQNENIASLLNGSPNIVVADEAHSFKNPASGLAKVMGNFKTKIRIALTGSPLANSVEEYHSMIDWLAPNYLGSHDEFASVYANPIKEGLYADSTRWQKRKALQMLKVLKETVAPKVHRVTMAALKSELPVKQEFILFLPITDFQRKAYTAFLNLVAPSGGGIANAQISQVGLFNLVFNLTLLLAHPMVFQAKLKDSKKTLEASKLPSKQKLKKDGTEKEPHLTLDMVGKLLQVLHARDIDDIKHSAKVIALLKILDEAKRVGDKTLVFTQSRDTLDYLEEMFRRQRRNFARLDGDTQVHLRQNLIKSFNAGDDDVYLISTTSGGIGLNITGANRVVIFDFKWNPTQEQQAIGRAFRIGQTKPVFVYWLIVGGTHEAVLHNQQVFKTQLAARVVDKKNPAAWSQTVRDYTAAPKIVDMDEESLAKARGKDRVLDFILENNSQHNVRKIISTDTFEEEDPEDNLTPEELQGATEMIRLNQLRITDPKAFELQRQKGVGDLDSQRYQEQQQLFQQSMSNVSPPAQLPVCGVAGPSTTNTPSTLSHMRQPNEQASTSSPGMGQHPVNPDQTQNMAAHHHNQLVSATQTLPTGQAHDGGFGGPGSQTNTPLPLTANGQPVHIRNSQPSPKSPSPAVPKHHGVQATEANSSRVTGPPPGLVGSADNFRMQLRIQMRILLPELNELNINVETLEHDIVAAWSTAIGKDIPAMSRWALLTTQITQSRRFAKAVLFRHFVPDHFAMLSDSIIKERIRALEALTAQEFEETIRSHRKKPKLRIQDRGHQSNNQMRGEKQCKLENQSSVSQSGGKRKQKSPDWKRKSILAPPGRPDSGRSAQQSPKQGDAADVPIIIDD